MTAAGLLQVTLVKTSAALRFSKSERACAKSSTVFIILVSVFFLHDFTFCECRIPVPSKENIECLCFARYSIDAFASIKNNYANKIVHVSNSYAQCDMRV